MGDVVTAGAIVGSVFGFIAMVFLVMFLVGAVGLWLGAKLLGVRDVSFWRALLVAFVVALVSFGVTTICSAVPVVGSVIGFLASLALSVVIVERMFETTTGSAIVCLLVKWVLDTVAVIGLVFAFFGGATFLAMVFGR